MGKSEQRKGRAGEVELSGLLNQYGFQTRPGRPLNFGQEADIVGLPNVHCEVKRHEKLNLYSWIAQSEADAERFGDGLPIVCHRSNRKPWIVSMTLPQFIKLLKGNHE